MEAICKETDRMDSQDGYTSAKDFHQMTEIRSPKGERRTLVGIFCDKDQTAHDCLGKSNHDLPNQRSNGYDKCTEQLRGGKSKANIA